jgi:hypothetical protein
LHNHPRQVALGALVEGEIPLEERARRCEGRSKDEHEREHTEDRCELGLREQSCDERCQGEAEGVQQQRAAEREDQLCGCSALHVCPMSDHCRTESRLLHVGER